MGFRLFIVVRFSKYCTNNITDNLKLITLMVSENTSKLWLPKFGNPFFEGSG